MGKQYDFCGWATRANVLCSDGRVIKHDAFKDQDGATVPLVWNHQHNKPDNVLGHALLKNMGDGVYAYCTFNETETAKVSKMLVEHGDISSLSILANQLIQKGPEVVHGVIREVSLVLAGANPKAFIEEVMAHSDDGDVPTGSSVIYFGEALSLEHGELPDAEQENAESEPDIEHKDESASISHAEGDEQKSEEKSDDEETLADVYNTLTDKQKNAVCYMIGQALEEGEGGSDNDAEHSAIDENNENKRFHYFGENKGIF